MERRTYFVLGLVTISILLLQSAVAGEPVDWAQRDRYRAQNDSIHAGLLERPEVVFLGNSLTDGWARFRPEFFSANHFLGRGISGQSTEHMLARFPQDVLALQPKKVVILCGTNDIACNNGRIRDEEIVDNIASMTTLARAHGIEPLVCTTLPCKSFWWNRELGDPSERIKHLNSLIRDYATQQGLVLVDYYPAMLAEDGGLYGAADGVHPDPDTYAIMEEIVLKALATEKKARVRLTFDDGLREHYTMVFPLLQAYGMSGVFYLIPDHINGQKTECEAKPMTWKMVQKMAAAGQRMASHGFAHIALGSVPEEEAKADIQRGDSVLRMHGLQPTLFAYPYGSRSEYTDSLVYAMGYEQIRPKTIAVGGTSTPTEQDVHRVVEDIIAHRQDAILMIHGITRGWDAWKDTQLLEILLSELAAAVRRGEIEMF